MNISRNAPCPCGSGKKHKQCCGKDERPAAPSLNVQAVLQQAFQQYQTGRLLQAEGLLQQVLAIQPQHPDALNLAGIVALETKQFLLAVERLQRAVKARPKMAAFHGNLGNALKATGQLEQAVQSYENAIRLDADYAKAYNNLGIALKLLERIDEAEKRFRQAVKREPNFAEAWANLGNTLQDCGKPEEAIPCLEQAIKLAPNMAEAHSTLGSALRFMPGQLDRALSCHEEALARMPGNLMAHWRWAFSLLTAGDLTRGWVEYGCRFQADPKNNRNFPQPAWQGEPLADKTLLIWGEQGVGDEILFAETIVSALQDGAKVLLECEPRLRTLFERSFPGALVFDRANPPQDRLLQADIDFQTPAGNLARWFRPSASSFPAHSGFLTPDTVRQAHWRDWLAQLGTGLKVGIAWRSMKRGRERNNYYTDLAQWGSILRTPGIDFVNLQYGDCREELEEARKLFGVDIHEAPGLNLKDDLDEAAALTRALDLVLGPKTSVTAMAGAVGRPTWLLNLDCDWTMLGTDHVPWFPSVEVFRKGWGEPWEPMLAEVAGRLAKKQAA
jgi:tetratricopeptide (TPR) repeat protein